jgi:hypothetical protein
MELANRVTESLAPYFPYLAKTGEWAVQEALKGAARGAWDLAKSLWSRLAVVVAADPVAQAAVVNLAAVPESAEDRAVLAM